MEQGICVCPNISVGPISPVYCICYQEAIRKLGHLLVNTNYHQPVFCLLRSMWAYETRSSQLHSFALSAVIISAVAINCPLESVCFCFSSSSVQLLPGNEEMWNNITYEHVTGTGVSHLPTSAELGWYEYQMDFFHSKAEHYSIHVI